MLTNDPFTLAWQLKLIGIAMFSLIAQHQKELSYRYGEAHRVYHSQRHIYSMLDLLSDAPVHSPAEVELAIWYHDAIYDPHAKDNEARSAALFTEHFGKLLRPVMLKRVAAMIEATYRHELPKDEAGWQNSSFRHDCGLFLDIDLAILAANEEGFLRYENAIRLEYAHVPDEKFRAGRAAILEKFLARKRIYFSDFFRDQFEARARQNLANSIAALS